MSDGSYGRIRTEPLQNIGAQDILSVGYNYYGFLRKKRRWDRLKGSSKWKQRFVVLSEGCLYCFNNESSAKPMAAFALCFYESAHELFLKVPHCFEIKHEELNRDSLIFSSESGERQKLWIAHVKDCIEQCGQLSASSLNLSDQSIDEGIVADKALERPFGRRVRDVPLPPVPTPKDEASQPPAVPQKPKKYKETARSEYDLESEEEEEEDEDEADIYDDIEDEDQTSPVAAAAASKTHTLPVGRVPMFPGLGNDFIPTKRPVSLGSRPKVPLPIPASKGVQLPVPKSTHAHAHVPLPVPKPSPVSAYVPVSPRNKDSSSDDSFSDGTDYINIFNSQDYLFDSNDREKAKQLLVGHVDGTFLIRKSRSSASQVLSVVANREVKEFQITEEGRKVSVDKSLFFPSLDAMLNYYHQNDLPKSDYKVKLKLGYKAK